MRRKYTQAFTLVELLVVVLIIGILFGLLTTSLRRVRDNSLKMRASTDVRTLASAIWTYRQEYGNWPCKETEGTSRYVSDNRKVLEYLGPADKDKNPRGITFVNFNEYLTEKDGKTMPLGDYGGNVVDPRGKPYAFIFDIDQDRGWVTNSTWGLSKSF